MSSGSDGRVTARFGDLEPAGFFVLRTPLLSAAEFDTWASAGDRSELRAQLREVLGRAEVRDALFIATPSLLESLDSWARAPDSERGLGVEKPLVRYFARMSRRPTPFGLFAGTSVGKIGDRSHLALPPRARYRRHTSLSYKVLGQIAERIALDPRVRERLLFFPNSSLARVGGALTYQRALPAEGGEVKGTVYHRLSIDPDPLLLEALSVAERGATLKSLRRALKNVVPTASRRELDGFLEECIDARVLEPDFGPPLTGPDPTRGLAKQLKVLASAAEQEAVMSLSADQMAEIDRAGVGASVERYRAVAATLSKVNEVDLPRLFHAELVKPAADLTLSRAAAQELLAGVDLLGRLSPSPPTRRELIERFERRFGEREVPLLEALSAEYGIGDFYGSDSITSPPLEKLPSPTPKTNGASVESRDTFLLRRAIEALRSKGNVLELRTADIPHLGGEPERPLEWPAAFCVFATFAASPSVGIDGRHHQILISQAIGPSGAELMGRFCNADSALEVEVRTLLKREEALRPNVLFAELVHLQPGLIEGGILARPTLRRCEIPYLGQSGINARQRIPMSDLRVALHGGKFVLRSASRGVQVVPRMSNAHAINESQTGVYRFLNAVIHQDDRPFTWRWGAARELPRLPRVASGKFVYALARWRLYEEELSPFTRARGAAERGRCLERWRADLALPRFVTLAEADKKLPVDFENELSVDAFAGLLGSRKEIELEELFPALDQLCVSGPEGPFAHEMLVPFIRAPPARPPRSSPKTRAADRAAAPSPSCLYFKLYGGPAGADALLARHLPKILREGRANGDIRRWFFIRYADPDRHLRVRLFAPAKRLDRLGPKLRRYFQRLGLTWRVQIDEYDREVFRYGGSQGIELAERLFQLDSDAVLELLRSPGLDADPMLRWSYAVVSADDWLEAFGFDLSARARIVERAAASWAARLGTGADHKHLRGEKYREYRATVERLLDRSSRAENLRSVWRVIDRRRQKAAPILRRYRDLEKAGTLTLPLDAIAENVLHMAMNRTFRDRQNEEELLIYDFLRRAYESALARQRSRKPDAKRTKRSPGSI